MAGLLNIGLSALNVAQSQLSTTSHNIANAGTEGFTRQRVVQTTNEPLFTGVGFFGQGTRVANVTRAYSQFLENQVLNADNRRAEYSAYNAQISQLDNLFADSSVGLSTTLDGFFAGVQEVAANPTSLAARQALISTGESLVARFQSLDQRIDEVRQGVEGQIGATVDQINTFARAIADMNQRIVIAQSAGSSVPANDLLDQRNQLVTELNRLIKVNAVPDGNGSLSVFIGSGQTLVLGNTASTLKAVPSANDPQRGAVALVASNGTTTELPEKLLVGGEIAGLLGFRREALDPAQNRLGLIAVSLGSAFNQQHRLGIDLDGILGQDFFRLAAVAVQPSDAASISIDPGAIGELTDADYRLSFDGSSHTLTNLSSGNSATVVAGDSFEGLRIDALGSLAAGASALVQPTRFAAGEIAMAISDTRKVAAGNPVASTLPSANAGTLKVSDIVVTDVTGMDTAPAIPDGKPDFAPFSLSWSANTLSLPPGYALTSGNPPAADNTYDPVTEGAGKTFELSGPGGFTFSFRLSGLPADGDSFSFGTNVGGVADNRNASLLGALQTTKLLFNAGATGTASPTATLGNAYAQLVSRVGNKTREVQVNEQAQDALLAQASDAREALSGVNLDEEAANLVRFQQSYQAAGQVMTVAQRLFDSLLAIGR